MLIRFHPGFYYELRKKSATSDSGAQATYDANGNIITSGLAAGTADKISPLSSKAGHYRVDVMPFNWAYSLDWFFVLV